MAFEWKNMAKMIDLNKGHANVDLTPAKGYVDAVQIYMGRPVPGDPMNPYYDPECANNLDRVIAAKIPACGLMVELKPSFWTTDPWKVNLDDVRNQDRSKNPMYTFIKHFFDSTRIQSTLASHPETKLAFITLVVDETSEGAVWNMADLLANIKHLNAGMKEGEIPKVKVFVACMPDLVNSPAWIQGYGTKDAANLFEQYFYRDNVAEGVMVQAPSSKPGTYTSWDQLVNALPNYGVRPTFTQGSKKGEVAYLGAKPCPWWWQHTFSAVYLPTGKTGTIQFGISSSFYTAVALYNYLGVAVAPDQGGDNEGDGDNGGDGGDTGGTTTVDLTGLAAVYEQEHLIMAKAHTDAAALWAGKK